MKELSNEVDKKKELAADVQTAASPSASATTLDNPGSQTTPAKKTRGEAIYNGVVYTGVGYFVNLFLGVVIADYFCNGKGKPSLEKFTRWTAGGDPKKINSMAGVWKTLALNSGGNLMMIPIKFAEDGKRHIVHWINRKLGEAEPITKDGKEVPISQLKEEELPALVSEVPKQSWLRVIARRVLGVGLTMTIGGAIGTERLTKIEDALTNKAISTMKNSNSSSMQAIGNNNMFQRYARLTALDQFYTVITAMTTYMTNGSKKKTFQEQTDAAEIIADQLDPNDSPADKKTFTSRVEPKEITPAKAQTKDGFEAMVTQQKQQAETAQSLSA